MFYALYKFFYIISSFKIIRLSIMYRQYSTNMNENEFASTPTQHEISSKSIQKS
jgi:hypothetical protein